MENSQTKRMLNILRIGHDCSKRGAGISLRDALTRTNYSNVRNEFDAHDLLPFLKADRDLVEQWVMYSEDKRTSGGWWIIKETCEVGCIGFPEKTQRFESLDHAVAEFVVRELDFWSRLRD